MYGRRPACFDTALRAGSPPASPAGSARRSPKPATLSMKSQDYNVPHPEPAAERGRVEGRAGLRPAPGVLRHGRVAPGSA